MKTDRTTALPLFPTQVIGSLPRPALVQDLHARRSEIDADRFAARLDEMTVFAIRLQEQAGLDVVSDGEWRRTHYIQEYLERIGGFETVRPFEHGGETLMGMVCTGRMQVTDPVFAEDAAFLARHTDRIRKFALPSPFLIGIRYWDEEYSKDAYPTMQHFMTQLTEILAVEAKALVAAGIDIVQLDDPALTYFCDRELMGAGDTHDERLRRNWDIDKQMPEAVDLINAVVSGLQAEVHLHCCHSVCKRQSDVTGNYEPILPRLADAAIDRVNLEFAYQNTGDISDLQFLPDSIGVGMGVIDIRNERLQTVEEIESLGAAGAAAIDPARIALNPECGFAPDLGEPPSIDEAYEKLQRLCTAASRLRERFGG